MTEPHPALRWAVVGEDGTSLYVWPGNRSLGEAIDSASVTGAASERSLIQRMVTHAGHPSAANDEDVMKWLPVALNNAGLVVMSPSPGGESRITTVTAEGRTDTLRATYDLLPAPDVCAALLAKEPFGSTPDHEVLALVGRALSLGDGIRLDALGNPGNDNVKDHRFESHRRHATLSVDHAKKLRARFFDACDECLYSKPADEGDLDARCFLFGGAPALSNESRVSDTARPVFGSDSLWARAAYGGSIEKVVTGPQYIPPAYTQAGSLEFERPAADGVTPLVFMAAELSARPSPAILSIDMGDSPGNVIGQCASMLLDASRAVAFALGNLVDGVSESKHRGGLKCAFDHTGAQVREAALADAWATHWTAEEAKNKELRSELPSPDEYAGGYDQTEQSEPNFFFEAVMTTAPELSEREQDELRARIVARADRGEFQSFPPVEGVVKEEMAIINKARYYTRIVAIRSAENATEAAKAMRASTAEFEASSAPVDVEAADIISTAIKCEHLHYGATDNQTRVAALFGAKATAVEDTLKRADCFRSPSSKPAARGGTPEPDDLKDPFYRGLERELGLLTPCIVNVRGPRLSHLTTACEAAGFYRLSPDGALGLATAKSMLGRLMIGTRAIRFLELLTTGSATLTGSEDEFIKAGTAQAEAATFIAACSRSIRSMTSGQSSSTKPSRVEREELDQLRERAMQVFVEALSRKRKR